MQWYYAEGGKQQGPVSGEEFEALIQRGAILPETLVWTEGMAKWQPYGEVKRMPSVAPAPDTIASPAQTTTGQGGLVCVECGRAFPAEQVMRFGEQWVCGGCKPIFLQRLREGGHPASGAGELTLEQLVARDYDVDVGGAISAGWRVFKSNPGLVLGVTVLVYLALFAVNVIPYLSMILSLVLTGPLMGGLWWFYIKMGREGTAEVGDAFAGFGPRFGQLLLAYVVPSLLAGLCVMPAVLAMLVGALAIPAATGGQGAGEPSVALIVAFVALLVPGLVGMIYLQICWLFAVPLVIDKGMRFWPAMRLSRTMVIKHWWGTLGLAIVLGLLAFAGILLLCLGLLITGPLAFAAFAAHYEKVFGELQPGAE